MMKQTFKTDDQVFVVVGEKIIEAVVLYKMTETTEKSDTITTNVLYLVEDYNSIMYTVKDVHIFEEKEAAKAYILKDEKQGIVDRISKREELIREWNNKINDLSKWIKEAELEIENLNNMLNGVEKRIKNEGN